MIDAIYKMLLTCDQRKLIAHQAATSYLLKPLKPPKADNLDRPLISDDETSKEDFAFINDDDLLYCKDTELLKGIIQP